MTQPNHRHPQQQQQPQPQPQQQQQQQQQQQYSSPQLRSATQGPQQYYQQPMQPQQSHHQQQQRSPQQQYHHQQQQLKHQIHQQMPHGQYGQVPYQQHQQQQQMRHTQQTLTAPHHHHHHHHQQQQQMPYQQAHQLNRYTQQPQQLHYHQPQPQPQQQQRQTVAQQPQAHPQSQGQHQHHQQLQQPQSRQQPTPTQQDPYPNLPPVLTTMDNWVAPMSSQLVSFDKPVVKKHYAKSVLIKESQFSFKNGSNACTYISLEAALYVLNGFVFADDPDLLVNVRRILQTGTQMDQGLGCTSCDQVLDINARFKRHIEKGNLAVGKLKDADVFKKLLELIVSKSGQDCQSVILTKPPETIALFYQPKDTQFPFIIFDSHPRAFEPKLGAGFYFFKDMQSCNEHLMCLFHDAMTSARNIAAAARTTASNGMEQYQQASKACYDATFVSLVPNVVFEEAQFRDGQLVDIPDEQASSTIEKQLAVDKVTQGVENLQVNAPPDDTSPVQTATVASTVASTSSGISPAIAQLEPHVPTEPEQFGQQEQQTSTEIDVDYAQVIRDLREKNAALEQENQDLRHRLNGFGRLVGEMQSLLPSQQEIGQTNQ